MNIQIDEAAASWYIQELGLKKGDCLRFFVRYGGVNGLQAGLSLGVQAEEPEKDDISIESEGVCFFVSKEDVWYFDGHDLHIVIDRKLNEPAFEYK